MAYFDSFTECEFQENRQMREIAVFEQMEVPSTNTLYTRRDAEEVAMKLSRHPLVAQVELFGSIARDGEGGDIDLILSVPEDIWNQFRNDMLTVIELEIEVPSFPGYFASSSNRRNIAEWVLFYAAPDDLLDNWIPRQGVDAFLFPKDWKNRIDELQRALPHRDPNFMSNVAQDAILIAS